MVTNQRIESLWGTGDIGGGLIHSHLRDDECGVRLLLQCVCVQLIVFSLFDSKDYARLERLLPLVEPSHDHRHSRH